MDKMYNISGTWKMKSKESKHVYGKWSGAIAVSDDGWFEGLAYEEIDTYHGGKFIFGVFNPNNTIELYKLSPINVNAPFVFHGEINNGKYIGDFEVIDFTGPIFSGNSAISVIEREADYAILQDFKTEIARIKNGLDDINALFYSNYINMRKSLCQIFQTDSKVADLTDEDYFHAIEVVGPMNEGIKQKIADEVMHLVREKPISTDSFDNFDLPF